MTGKPGSVESAVRLDLKGMGKDLEGSGLAAVAVAMAQQIDADNSATSKSMCAKALQDILSQLRALAPARAERDRIDDLADKRNRRRATA